MNKDELTCLYNEVYRLNKSIRTFKKKRNYFILKWAFANIPIHSTVLDVGCGAGHLMRSLRTGLYKVAGTEISDWALENLLTDLPVKKLFAEDLHVIPDNTYDCVLCSDVLEHMVSEKVIIDAVSNITRISKKYIMLTVSPAKSRGKKTGNVKLLDNDLHLTRRSTSWWVNMLSSHFKLLERQRCGNSVCIFGVKNEENCS